MALEVLELHHHAVRMPLGKVEAMGAFYGDVLGLDTDQGRWRSRHRGLFPGHGQ